MTGRTLSLLSGRLLPLTGPLVLSAAGLVAMVLVQQSATPALFGLFAFCVVLSGFGQGLCNALFATPLVVALARTGERDNRLVPACVLAALVLSGLTGILVWASAVLLGGPQTFALALGFWAGAAFLRWFFRSLDLALLAPSRAVRSDLLTGTLTLAGLVVLVLTGATGPATVAKVMAGAMLLALGLAALAHRTALRSALKAPLAPFITLTRQHGRWALLGVAGAEMAANGHAYVVTLVLGPAAFAPIALATLLLRPFGVVLMALVGFERPALADCLRRGARLEADRRMEVLGRIAALAVAVNLLAAAGLVAVLPEIGGEGYSPSLLWTALALVSAGAVLRALRTPQSVALQAEGALRPLAMASLRAAPVALGATLLVVLCAPGLPALAALGIVAGELALAAGIARAFGAKFSARERLADA
ncbi:hypothetical protein [Pelagibacterium montanilacus]|uniref:hypothetical protein n=1 Tax=Pelagibacterium montanilacus TaxID=2185280 RepID=UPI000F8CC663|nr:hypothetical protein [Pelagibacterium montanilacus]